MALRETLDELLADHEVRHYPKITPRALELPRLPGKADVVVGMRRSGKTYVLYQELQRLEARGVPRERTVFLSLEDERLLPLAASDLHQISDAFYARHPRNRDEECWFLLDEIHNVPGWERFVRRLVETDRTRVILTGSSAKLLSREIATSLRGRSLATEVLPFSFGEALAHAGVPRPRRWPPAAAERSGLEHQLRRYLDVGGFPEVQTVTPAHRTAILQEYVDVVLFRDVAERHGVTNLPALRHLTRRLGRTHAQHFTANKLHGELRSAGIAVAKNDIHAYVDHLEEAYFVFLVGLDAESEKRRLVNPRKAYLADHALARALSPGGATHRGRDLENVVYLELRRRGLRPSYGLTDGGHEIDFVVRQGDPQLVQVTESLVDPDVRQRELGALEAGMRERGIRSGLVVTVAEEEQLRSRAGTIRVVPAWRWLLEG